MSAAVAWMLCDSGWDGDQQVYIGQGHLLRCQAFAAQFAALGWRTELFELSLAALPQNAPGHRRYQLSLDELRSSRSLQGLPFMTAEPKIPDLLLIDSYQLPWDFYSACARNFPLSRLLAIDDFERFASSGGYPSKFFVLQAGMPAQADLPDRYLRGLAYQILRPEFGVSFCGETEFAHEELQTRYRLFVPGSAFSFAQVELAAACLAEEPPTIDVQDQERGKWHLAVLLSPRQVEDFPADRMAGPLFLWGLDAAQLRHLYAGAGEIFCAASQSLLEALAVKTQIPAREGMRKMPAIFALLTAENQVPLLDILRASSQLDSQAWLRRLDLRGALQSASAELLCNCLRTGLARIRKAAGLGYAAIAAESEPNVASASLQCELRQLGDGLALQRILEKIGVAALAQSAAPCDNNA